MTTGRSAEKLPSAGQQPHLICLHLPEIRGVLALEYDVSQCWHMCQRQQKAMRTHSLAACRSSDQQSSCCASKAAAVLALLNSLSISRATNKKWRWP
jgi:hypothetical protein